MMTDLDDAFRRYIPRSEWEALKAEWRTEEEGRNSEDREPKSAADDQKAKATDSPARGWSHAERRFGCGLVRDLVLVLNGSYSRPFHKLNNEWVAMRERVITVPDIAGTVASIIHHRKRSELSDFCFPISAFYFATSRLDVQSDVGELCFTPGSLRSREAAPAFKIVGTVGAMVDV